MRKEFRYSGGMEWQRLCNIRQAFCFVVCVYPQNRIYKEKSQRFRILLLQAKVILLIVLVSERWWFVFMVGRIKRIVWQMEYKHETAWLPFFKLIAAYSSVNLSFCHCWKTLLVLWRNCNYFNQKVILKRNGVPQFCNMNYSWES